MEEENFLLRDMGRRGILFFMDLKESSSPPLDVGRLAITEQHTASLQVRPAAVLAGGPLLVHHPDPSIFTGADRAHGDAGSFEHRLRQSSPTDWTCARNTFRAALVPHLRGNLMSGSWALASIRAV